MENDLVCSLSGYDSSYSRWRR